jgi:hypothetical protein
MNESFCAFLFMTKNAKRRREEKRNSLLFFSTFSARVDAKRLTQNQSLFFFLAFGIKIFLLFQEDEGSQKPFLLVR